MTKFKVGQIVWVRTGLGSHEEPASILQVSCHYVHVHEEENCISTVPAKANKATAPQKNEHGSNHEKDDNNREIMEEKKDDETMENQDGILVRYNVSLVEATVHYKTIRTLIEEEEEENDRSEKDKKRRRSSRNRTPSSTPVNYTSSTKRNTRTIKKEKNVMNKNSNDDGDDGCAGNGNNLKGTKHALVKTSKDCCNEDNETLLEIKVESNKKRKSRKISDVTSVLDQSSSSSSTKKRKTKNADKESRYFQENDSGEQFSTISKKSKSPKEAKGDTSVATKTKIKAQTQKKKDEASNEATGNQNISRAEESNAGKPDGMGGLGPDSIYIIEYAKTGRSTCKRCDIKIKKGEIRVGHRPLFRGKPGFRIYKHLHCIVFSLDVQCIDDVDGSEDLTADDGEKLIRRIEESRQEVKEESEALDPDELVQKGFEGEIRNVPKGLNANLLPFQTEGVSWMYCQEVNVPEIRGGILADEMGMGKTIQTITTLLDNRPKLQHSQPGAKNPPLISEELKTALNTEEKLWGESLKAWKHEMKMNSVPSSVLPKQRKCVGGARAGTLVICPVIALSQWKSEIEKFCEPNALSVCIYHGPDRVKNVPREMIRKYDVVLTTYQVIEQDFRKMISPNKVKCPNCGNKFKIDKLHVHLKYFCGEGAQRTEAQARTRRNSDRNDSSSNRSSRSSSSPNKGKSQKSVKKKSMTKKKKAFKVKGDMEFVSESDLSVHSESFDATKTFRSPRAAAAAAKSRVAAVVKRETRGKIGDSDDESNVSDDDYEEEISNYEDDSKGEEDIATTAKERRGIKKSTKKVQKYVNHNDDVPEDDDTAIERARSRQAVALVKAKWSKKSGKSLKGKKEKVTKIKKKTVPMKKKDKKQGNQAGGLSNKKASGSPPTSSDDDSESVDDASLNVDMDVLIAEAMEGCRLSVLHSFCWWRVVLDEAHFIKSRSSQTSAAAFALTGIHRWCLSGTPLQNRVGEFYSLVRFLRLDPMAHYFCRSKDCTCKQVHYRMQNARCMDCGHSSIQHYSHFNRKILNPIQRDGYANDGRRAMFTLKNDVLDRCLLRRTKDTRAEDMNLPPRIVTIKSIRLHPIEEDFYNSVFTQTTSSFNDYVAEGTLMNNYAHIFDLLMRMRQAVCHPYLVVYSKRDVARRSAAAHIVSNGSVDCHLCDEPPTQRVVSTCCQTAFCKSCVLEYMELSAGVGGEDAMSCPSCRNPFTIDLNRVQDIESNDSILTVPKEKISKIGLPSLRELAHVASGSILRRIDLTEFATSSKIEALTMELVKMRNTSPGSKAIVFSQFVNMLDLIRWRLHSDPYLAEMGLGVRALHGSMNVKSRDAALKDFREDHNVRVLLVSLKAGGVALNLTVANHIYLMDPWWNPAAEMQAIDRTHRLGQYRPIRAVRFIAENTVEERILQLQEKKRLVFDGTVGRDAGSLKMLTVNDMKSLFG